MRDRGSGPGCGAPAAMPRGGAVPRAGGGGPAGARRQPRAAALIPAAALVLACIAAAALPPAHADGGQPAAAMSAGAAPADGPRAVPFALAFDRAMNSSTIDASDIEASSGTVLNLRAEFRHAATLDGRIAGDGRFNAPSGVAVDGSGSVYVADTRNGRVRVFDSSGAGAGELRGPFGRPTGVAVDASTGAVYVADAGSGGVSIFDPAGNRTGELRGPFGRPSGVAVDASTGAVYVADAGSGAVHTFGPSGNRTGGIDYPFSEPAGVAVDASTGAVYVADAGSGRVLAFDPSLRHAGDLRGQFHRPAGVAADGAGAIYVADAGSGRVQVFNSTLHRIADLPGPLYRPAGVAAGADGAVYVADAAGDRIMTFRAAYEFSVADPAGGVLEVGIPAGRALDAAGNANAASNAARIHVGAAPAAPAVTPARPGPTGAAPVAFSVEFGVNVTGFNASGIALSGAAGRGGVENFTGEGASYSFAVHPGSDGAILVDIPAGAARDAAGGPTGAAARLSVAYDGTPPAPAIAPALPGPTGLRAVPFGVGFGEIVDAATFDASDINASSGTVANLRAEFRRAGAFGGHGQGAGQFDNPRGVAVDSSTGAVYVADTWNDRVQAFGPAGDPAGELRGQFSRPHGVAVDSSTGAVYVADTHNDRVRAFNSTLHHTGDIDYPFDAPHGVAVDPSGRVYVADTLGGAVRIFDSALRHVADVRGPLSYPHGVAVDHSGRVYAAEPWNHTVRVFDSALRHVADVRGPLSYPHGVAVDPSGAIYVPDARGAAVRVFDPALRHVADLPGPLGGPAGVAAGGPGRVYVADTWNYTVLAFDAAYAFDVEDPADGILEVGIPAGRVLDAAGNANAAPGAAGILVDRTAPAPSVTSAQGGLTGAATIGFEVNFGEPVSGFGAGDVVLSGTAGSGGVENFTGKGASYSFLVSPASDGTILVDIPAGAAADRAGNPSLASERFSAGYYAKLEPRSSPGGGARENQTGGGAPATAEAQEREPGPPGAGPRVPVGVLAAGPGDPSAAAARLGAEDFNRAAAERGYAFSVGISEYAVPAGASGAEAEAALRAAHDGGRGPVLYIGPASDRALRGMAGYAAEHGITLVSHSSAARSLAGADPPAPASAAILASFSPAGRPPAAAGDGVYRLEPGAAHMARALAHEVARGGFAAVVPAVQAGLHGPADGPDSGYGLLGPLESYLAPLGVRVGPPVEFSGGEGAASVWAAVLAAAGNGTGRSVAVVYVGSDSAFAAIAGNASAGSHAREMSVWFAAGGAGAGAGTGVAASPLVVSDEAAVRLARDVELTAVQFAVGRSNATDRIDAAVRGAGAAALPAASATPAYAAYEAARVLGRALALAGGNQSGAGGHVAAAAEMDGGPLGRMGLDRNGDLRLPVTYGAWSVSDAAAEWVRAPEPLRGADTCGMSLERPSLSLPSPSPGRVSGAAVQTVTNTGTMPLPPVSVAAGDWILRGGGSPPGATLPFSLTEMSVGAAGFSPLAADSAIPGGTPAGGSVDVGFRVDLTGVPSLDAGSMEQAIAYGVDC